MDRRTFGRMMAALAVELGTDARGLAQSGTTGALPPNPPEMSVPTGPLRIGDRKQLFVDRWIVDETSELLFTVVPPMRHGDLPVMMPEQPADESVPYAQAMNPILVRWDEKKRLFQMWYDAVYLGPHKEAHAMAYAESDNGIDWRKPHLGLKRLPGSDEDNFINLPGTRAIVLDEHGADPQKRFISISGGINPRMWFSADGLHWTASEKGPVFTHIGDTHSILGWDATKQKYVAYFRPRNPPGPAPRRTIGISYSDDAETWTPIQEVIVPDQHEPAGTEFYYMAPLQYADMYMGVLTVLHMDHNIQDFNQKDPEGAEQTADAQLVASRDGVHWTRMGNRQPWLRLGDYQSWDDQNLWPSTPVVHGGRIWIYYGGQPLRHTIPDLRNFGKKREGRTLLGGIGLATLREDGWVAVRPNLGRKGVLTTRPLVLEHKELYVNVDATRGHCGIELLAEDGSALPGFSGANGAVVSGDALRARVRWRHNLEGLIGKPVRLRFTLEKSELYAFQFSS